MTQKKPLIDRPTGEQEAFLQACKETKQSLLLEAVAGSGKTTTLMAGAHLLKHPGLALAFNRKIALELKQRVPSGWEASTFNSLGHRAVSRMVPHKLKPIDEDKIYRLTRAADVPRKYFVDTMKLARLCKVYGVAPRQHTKFQLLPDSGEELQRIADFHNLEVPLRMFTEVRKILWGSIREALKGTIDYDDQLYMPLSFKCPFDRYRVVLVDEVQDLSLVQQTLLKRLLMPKGRLIAAGDRYQAIYGFRGALSNSIDALIETFGLQQMPLTESFRCPQLIVLEAQEEVSEIRATPDAPMGRVTHLEDFSVTDVPPVVLCRNTAPLVNLGMELLDKDRPVHIAGRDIGKGLIALVERIAPRRQTRDSFLVALSEWAEKQMQKRPRQASQILDQANALGIIAQRAGGSSGVIATLRRLYNDQAEGKIYLSTIHKAKGLEWPEVMFLDPHLVNSGDLGNWQLEQERNLRYVAKTRAQDHLIYATSETYVP